MEMSSLIIMHPNKKLVLLDSKHLLPVGSGSPADVAEKWLKRKFEDSEFRHIIEYHPNDEMVVNIYLLLTSDIAAAIPEGFHFYGIESLFSLLADQPNRIAGWATMMALHPNACPVRISKLPVTPESAEAPADGILDGEPSLPKETPTKKKRGK